MNKKKVLTFFVLIFLISTNLFSNDAENVGVRQNFSFAASSGVCLIPFEFDTLDFYEFGFKFDYQFFKEIGGYVKLGFGLSFGDSINIGGFMTLLIYRYFTFNFFNELSQKISFNALVGNDWNNKYALFELGAVFSFTAFFSSYYEYYYLTLFVSPYLFIGFVNISSSSHIFGGFFEYSFDVGKYTTDVYSIMRPAYGYISFGIEYRIGYCLDK
ncbi:MAG TPA: hypothetical protein PLG34_05540 [Spirochaetota bacterium]|jgi:hypothetical protein|nr:MAG: hypothetical protein BWX91_00078 [Spirochaetes bacterium ADurb.Bin133]HNZ26392.1 hypothetical protein [Spirochaetota bacterium]HPY87426.1 hypothetical protein [Spirochaetota bacterium]HQB61980.1 hypothetical protein [Spirochaetota bacterium]